MWETHKAETGEHALGRVVAVGHDDETGDDAVRCDDDVCARGSAFFKPKRGDETPRHATRVVRERASKRSERMDESHYGNNMSFCVSTGMIILR